MKRWLERLLGNYGSVTTSLVLLKISNLVGAYVSWLYLQSVLGLVRHRRRRLIVDVVRYPYTPFSACSMCFLSFSIVGETRAGILQDVPMKAYHLNRTYVLFQRISDIPISFESTYFLIFHKKLSFIKFFSNMLPKKALFKSKIMCLVAVVAGIHSETLKLLCLLQEE